MKRTALTVAIFALGALYQRPAEAVPLSIAKSTAIVADAVNLLNPRALPGSTIDYAMLVSNPAGNLLTPVRNVVLEDAIPATVKLRVSDLAGAGKGPVDFVDGSLLGLLGSNLSYSYTGLGAASDGLEFFNGTSWGYTPVPDAGGYDANVRRIRVTLTGTQAAGSAFQLRYRVTIR